jgi:LmbE family N-acetylglucosaminyl deacetylase
MGKILLLIFGFFFWEKGRGVPPSSVAYDLALVTGALVLVFLVIGILLGLFGGWLFFKKGSLFLLKIKNKDRVLILTPHPDDETLSCGGLIASLSKRRIPFKVVFLTCGDANPSLFWRDKKVSFSPKKLIQTGEERKKEAEKALSILGAKKRQLVFLGYPDSSLWPMWKNKNSLITAHLTRLTHSPYEFSFRRNAEYKGENLLADLIRVIKQFCPTVVILSHRYDFNKDHRATFLFGQLAVNQSQQSAVVYQYLVHYKVLGLFRVYPPKRRKGEEVIIYPPKALFKKGKWFSFWLDDYLLKEKRLALEAYKSQSMVPTLKRLFRSFLVRNEIFEKATS